ncbi:uncharacterized protein LOC122021571 [Zingiber officinale]|uniref:uncharacterized protein LOC122021571 n=1 Tax=Zingiber officinale TaxID=94328 RepID=UPI001C4CEC6E|nr:uncharacterized protein LOC122021571 [Zingiber officinale]XP_042435622.1 uncharacterized protein LOC122021571 [Zingiber officinale]XP_042435623.1 uncharacterized protein LOC122021571 [Zingiber officinale]
MERFLRKYDRECMKMMMMKHEETFRQQVQELHRLYRVQKLLMRDVKDNELKSQSVTNFTHSNQLGEQKNAPGSCLLSSSHKELRLLHGRRVLNLELPADQYIERAEEDGGDIELALTIGNNWRKGDEVSFTSDEAASFSSSSTETGGLKLSGNGWELPGMEEGNFCYDSNRKNGYEMEGVREESLKQPSWHIQCLSLKMA